ncbi:MAG TPA: DUF697 domain-containing protein [Myxococcales bacterium]|jgi:uncharacterized protein (DUF697 family)
MPKRKTTTKSKPGPFARTVANDWVEENGYRVAAAAAVPVPIPGAHTALCTALEAYMISNIAQIYGRSLTIGECVAMVPTLGGAVVVGKAVSSIAGEVLGWIPFAGWVAKGAVGGATAYGIGKAAVHWFESKHPDQEAADFEKVSLRDFVQDALAELGVKKGDAKAAAEKVAKEDGKKDEDPYDD